MARFRGTVQGQRSQASRLGHSELTVAANGWDVGARVDLDPDGDDDVVTVWITSGSNGNGHSVCLGRFHRNAHSEKFEVFRDGEPLEMLD